MDEDVGSKYLVRLLFGKELGDAMKDAEGSYRKIMETTTPVTQCIRAGHPFKNDGTDVCYICGFDIPVKGDLPSNPVYPECEHILPVGQARVFLDIYSTRQSSSSPEFSIEAKKWYDTAMLLEYDQAHRICNQAKSNSSYIGNPEFWETDLQFNEETTLRILEQIKKDANEQLQSGRLSRDHIPIIQNIANMNTEVRINAIRPKVDAIINHIGKFDPAENGLLLLARLSELRNPDRLPDRAREIYLRHSGVIDNRTEVIKAIQDIIFRFMPELKPGAPIQNLIYDGEYIKVPVTDRLNLNEKSMEEILTIVYNNYGKSFSRETTPHFIHLVYYIIYGRTLKNYLEAISNKFNPVDAPDWACKMFGIMHSIEITGSASARASVSELKRQLNLDTKKLKSACDIRARKLRGLRVSGTFEDKMEEEKIENKLVSDADHLYESTGFSLYELIHLLVDFRAINAAQAATYSDEAVEYGKEIFIKSRGKGKSIEESIEESADSSSRLFAGRILLHSNLEISDIYRIAAYDNIISNARRGLVSLKGGLRKQRRSKSNARRSHSRDIRTTYRKGLRKRTGKGRTHRVRQRTGKSRSGK